MIDAYHQTDCIKAVGFKFTKTEMGNFKALRKKGYKSLTELFDAHFDRKDKAYATTGDICLEDKCVGIYQYSHAVFWGKSGLRYVPRADLGIIYDLASYHE